MGLWFTELQNRISSSEITSESICSILQTKANTIVSNLTGAADGIEVNFKFCTNFTIFIIICQ